MNTSTQYFPSPYTQSSGTITFTDLPADCTIEIFTLNGSPIIKLVENDGDGQHAWDIKNASGEKLSSGVYIYVINTGSNKKTGKLVIK